MQALIKLSIEQICSIEDVDGSGSWGVGRCLSESSFVALVDLQGNLLLTGGERAILVEQRQSLRKRKPLDWQNGCEKWELIQTQSNLIQLVCPNPRPEQGEKRTNIIGTIGDSLLLSSLRTETGYAYHIPTQGRNERKLYSESKTAFWWHRCSSDARWFHSSFAGWNRLGTGQAMTEEKVEVKALLILIIPWQMKNSSGLSPAAVSIALTNSNWEFHSILWAGAS